MATEGDDEGIASLIDAYVAATTHRKRAAVILRMGQTADVRLSESRRDFLERLDAEKSDDLGSNTWQAAATALVAFDLQERIDIYWDWRSPDLDFIRRDIGLFCRAQSSTDEAGSGQASLWDRFVSWWNRLESQ